MKSWSRRGFAIPLVAGFCVILSILISITTFLRTNANRQQKADWQGMKAHYIAQGAIQAALYKFRVLPNEGYDASSAAVGGNPVPLATFLSDVGTIAVPPGTGFIALAAPGSDFGTRTAVIVGGQAINSVEDIGSGVGSEIWKHVLQLEAEGTVTDSYRGTDGNIETRKERLTKIVEIRKVR